MQELFAIRSRVSLLVLVCCHHAFLSEAARTGAGTGTGTGTGIGANATFLGTGALSGQGALVHLRGGINGGIYTQSEYTHEGKVTSEKSPTIGTEIRSVKPIPAFATECPLSRQTRASVRMMVQEKGAVARQLHFDSVGYGQLRAEVAARTRSLNEQIRQLNQLKADLADRYKHVETKKYRLQELDHQMDLVRVNDVVTCLSRNKETVETNQKSRGEMLDEMQKKKKSLNDKIKQINKSVKKLSDTKKSD